MRFGKVPLVVFLAAIALAFVGTPTFSAAGEGPSDATDVELVAASVVVESGYGQGGSGREEASGGPVLETPPVDPVEGAEPIEIEMEGADLPVETEFDLNDPEVTQYAGHYGVDLDRALEIATWMDAGGLYVDNLREMLEGNWADSQLVHGGGRGGEMDDPTMDPGRLRLEIFLADSEAPEATEVLARIPKLGGMTTEVIEVPLSRVELDALAADLVVPDGMMVQYNVREGTVEIVPRTDHEIAVVTPRTVDAPESP